MTCCYAGCGYSDWSCYVAFLYADCHYACVVIVNVILMIVIIPSVAMPNAISLSMIVLNVTALVVFTLSVAVLIEFTYSVIMRSVIRANVLAPEELLG